MRLVFAAPQALEIKHKEQHGSDLQQLLLGRLLLAVAILQRSPVISSSTSLLPMADTLLPWAIRTATVDLYALSAQRGLAGRSPLFMVCHAGVMLTSACAAFYFKLADARGAAAWKVCLDQLYTAGE